MSGKDFPEVIEITIGFANAFGFAEVGVLFDKMWGDADRLERASEHWGYASSAILAEGLTAPLENSVENFIAEGHWAGEASKAYLSWARRIKLQTLEPLAKKADDMVEILNQVAVLMRGVKRDLTLASAIFLATIGIEYYKGRPGKGAHVKLAGGKHAKGRKGGLEIAVILAALAIMLKELRDYWNKLTAQLHAFQAKIERLHTVKGNTVGGGGEPAVRPPFGVIGDPREWKR